MKQVFTLIATVVLILAPQVSSASSKTIRLCMPRGHEDLLNMALLVARDNGLFKKNGLDVKIELVRNTKVNDGLNREFTYTDAGPVVGFNNEDWALTDLLIGKKNCDIAVSPVVGMLGTQATDVTLLKPLYMTAYGTDYDTHLVVRNDSPIKTIKDLKGKVVRIGQVPTHIALYNMLKKNDMKVNDVTLRFGMASNFASEALANGEIDAAVTYVPTMPMMLASGKVRVLEQNIISKYVLPRTPNAILFTTREFASANPKVIENLKNTVVATMDYINKNPSSVLKAATGFFTDRHGKAWKGWKANPAQVERAAAFLGKLSVESFDDVAESAIAQKQMDEYQTLLMSLGYITHKVDLSSWFSPAAKQAAL